MRFPAILPAVLLAACLLGPAVPAASARTSLDVDMGWGGTIRVGRWMPIYVTAADDQTREVRVDIEIGQGGPYLMRLKQYLVIGPRPTTVMLYAPFRESWGDPPTVVLRDLKTGKTVARWPPDGGMPGAGRAGLFEKFVQGEKKFVGVVGPNGRLDRMESDTGQLFQWSAVKPEHLPDAPVGYDALDLLVLQRADLNRLDRDRQQAIVDWVRAGGCVLVIPSDEPMPSAGPLADVVPCRPGAPVEYVLPDDVRRWLQGTGRKATGVRGFTLTPKPGAEAVRLWPAGDRWGEAAAYAADVGFGRIVVAPFDITQLAFGNSGDANGVGRRLYGALLAGTGLLDKAARPNNGGYSYGLDPIGQRQEQAISTLQDHLGAVPGAGRFGFSYVAWVVLGMMVLVGPVDWFVLKRLGRQPWTWVTTTGWIGLVTVAALYAGHVFKSGDLHYRTVGLVDQADGRVVARTTLAGLYSPKTTTYHFDAPPTQTDAQGQPVPTGRPPAGWWDPAAATMYGGGGLKVDVPFHQTLEGNLPDPMTVNVWNLRFLRGENLVAGEPMVRASLRLTSGAANEPARLVGTITNVSDAVLTNVRVRAADPQATAKAAAAPPDPPEPTDDDSNVSPYLPTAAEAATASEAEAARRSVFGSPVVAARLAPGETANVDVAVTPGAGSNKGGAANTVVPNRRLYRYGYDGSVPSPESVWAIANDLSGRRGWRSDLAAADGKHAVVYATIEQANPAVVLREPGAIQRHEAFLRALVRLDPPAGGQEPAGKGGKTE